MNDLSFGLKMTVLKDLPTNMNKRRVGLEFMRNKMEDALGRSAPTSFAENEIKLKLFRMMHESISDSESKIKRAEMIRKTYENNTSFEIGFIVADTTDKYTTMVDVGGMLDRLFDEWRPIEHINAYEHIANKGIEISQLIELVKTVVKKNRTSSYRRFLNISL
ncbi:hypothetical protein RR48_01714 [Papilio machaon]|uniref:Uncharacterized protein n=1 Tax=Papilio machaon TaxID=76193 RepID=A0A0N1PGV4_PAPMA|nr:hypothetical protein RR48_01714 [Papilio machaon]